jgi:predicted MFS family arabinose efflux permease
LPTLELVRLRPTVDVSVAAAERPAPRAPARSDRRLILTFASVVFMTSLSTGFVWPFLNVYFVERLGATTELVGTIFVAIAGAMVVAQLAGPMVARQVGVVTGIWIARLVTLPLMLGMALVPSLSYAAAAVTLRGALVAMSWPLDNAFGLGLVSAPNAARLASSRSIAFNAGQVVSSLIAGQVIVGFGYPPTFVISAGGILLAGLVHYRSFRRDDPHPGLRGYSVKTGRSAATE